MPELDPNPGFTPSPTPRGDDRTDGRRRDTVNPGLTGGVDPIRENSISGPRPSDAGRRRTRGDPIAPNPARENGSDKPAPADAPRLDPRMAGLVKLVLEAPPPPPPPPVPLLLPELRLRPRRIFHDPPGGPVIGLANRDALAIRAAAPIDTIGDAAAAVECTDDDAPSTFDPTGAEFVIAIVVAVVVVVVELVLLAFE